MSTGKSPAIIQHLTGMSPTREDMLLAHSQGREVSKVSISIPMVVLKNSGASNDVKDVMHTFDGVMYNKDGRDIVLIKDEFDYHQDVEIDVSDLKESVIVKGLATDEDINPKLRIAREKEALANAERIHAEKVAEERLNKAHSKNLESLIKISDSLRRGYDKLSAALGHELAPDPRLKRLDDLYKSNDKMMITDYGTEMLLVLAERDANRMNKISELIVEQRAAMPNFDSITALGTDGMSIFDESFRLLAGNLRRNIALLEDGFLLETSFDKGANAIRFSVQDINLEERAVFNLESIDEERVVSLEYNDGLQKVTESANVKYITLDQEAALSINESLDEDNKIAQAFFPVLQAMGEKGVLFLTDNKFDLSACFSSDSVTSELESELNMPVLLEIDNKKPDYFELTFMLKEMCPDVMLEVSKNIKELGSLDAVVVSRSKEDNAFSPAM